MLLKRKAYPYRMLLSFKTSVKTIFFMLNKRGFYYRTPLEATFVKTVKYRKCGLQNILNNFETNISFTGSSHLHQRHIKDPVDYLRCSFFAKTCFWLKAINHFLRKAPSQIFDWILNTLLYIYCPSCSHFFVIFYVKSRFEIGFG